MKDWKIIIAIAIAAILLYWALFKPIVSEKAPELSISKGSSEESGFSKGFDKNYFAKVAKKKGKKPTDLLNAYHYPTSRIKDDVIALYEAKGAINDDETIVYNIIASVPNLFCLSALAFSFEKVYKISLISFLKSFLNEKELKKIMKIVNAKK